MNTTIMRSPMERFARAYADLGRRARHELQVSPGDSDRRFAVSVLGVTRAPNHLVISAPKTRDQSLIAVTKGHGMTCQWVNATTIFRFRALIANLAFEPVPMVYLGQLSAVRRRTLRALPRALAALSAAVRTPAVHAALVTDLSVSGARIGTASDLGVQAGQRVELAIRPQLFGRDFVLTLQCVLAGIQEHADPEHPLINFYGLQFERVSETDQLILHAYVQERLAQETDLLSQLLLSDATDAAELD